MKTSELQSALKKLEALNAANRRKEKLFRTKALLGEATPACSYSLRRENGQCYLDALLTLGAASPKLAVETARQLADNYEGELRRLAIEAVKEANRKRSRARG